MIDTMIEKKLAGEKAAEFIKNQMTVGLGTGSTVFYTINKIGEMVKAGMKIKAVSSSRTTTKLAESLGIKLYSLNEFNKIDITIDGVDEVDSNFNGIKGGGGALLFEKIVASASDKIVWVLDSSKKVDRIGGFPLPIEISPFGHIYIFNMLKNKGMNPVLRKVNDELFITESGNYIIDLHLRRIDNPTELALWLDSVSGIVEHGLFINMVDIVIIGKDGSTKSIVNRKK